MANYVIITRQKLIDHIDQLRGSIFSKDLETIMISALVLSGKCIDRTIARNIVEKSNLVCQVDRSESPFLFDWSVNRLTRWIKEIIKEV